MTTNSQFFDTLSGDYDVMIPFEKAVKNKIAFLKNFQSKNYRTALDLGCGTGADAIALSTLGLQVHAVDHSKGMVAQAMANAKKQGFSITFSESSLTDLALGSKSYDFMVSLGNTLANMTTAEVRGVVSKLAENLNEGGSILIQIINYAKLPKTGAYILNEFENDSVSITRRYDIKPHCIDFLIDKVQKESGQKSQLKTVLYPHAKTDFEKMAKAAGLDLAVYGNLKKDVFVAGESPNLVVVLRKTLE